MSWGLHGKPKPEMAKSLSSSRFRARCALIDRLLGRVAQFILALLLPPGAGSDGLNDANELVCQRLKRNHFPWRKLFLKPPPRLAMNPVPLIFLPAANYTFIIANSTERCADVGMWLTVLLKYFNKTNIYLLTLDIPSQDPSGASSSERLESSVATHFPDGVPAQ